MLFLQHCHGHAEDYASFCQFTLTRRPADCLAFFSDIYIGAKKILGEANDIMEGHEKGYKDLRRNRSKLMATFSRTLPPPPILGRSRVPERRRGSVDLTTDQYLQAAQAALRPDGIESVSASYLSLKDIGTSLKDITAFWDDHVVHLAAISEQRVDLVRPKAEVLKSVESWTRYQSVLLSAISSISESSDAVMVDPPVSQQDPHMAVTRRGFWDKFLRVLERLD
jgi:hypothetical protein